MVPLEGFEPITTQLLKLLPLPLGYKGIMSSVRVAAAVVWYTYQDSHLEQTALRLSLYILSYMRVRRCG